MSLQSAKEKCRVLAVPISVGDLFHHGGAKKDLDLVEWQLGFPRSEGVATRSVVLEYRGVGCMV